MALKYLTSENFDLEIKKSSTPIILDFYADWCGPCQMMGPVFESLSEEYQGKIKFMKVNTETEADLASKFGVSGIPTLILIKDNQEIDRIVGFVPKPVLKKKIDSTFK